MANQSNSVVILLDEARQKRNAAVRARRLAEAVTTEDVCELLRSFARELDDKAAELERRATELAESIARNHDLSQDVRSLVAEAHARLADMRSKKPPT